MRTWLAGLLLVVGCLYIYQGILGTGFVMFDDDVNIVYNEKLGPLTMDRLGWIASEHAVMVRYVPVGWILLCGLTHINGLDPFWFHGASLALHAGSCVLLYVFLKGLWPRVSKQGPGVRTKGLFELFPLCLAAWWGWHPLRVEPVAWATPLIQVLATFLGLSALLLLQKSAEAEARGKAYGWMRTWATLLCLTALLAHPSALSFIPLYIVLFIVIQPPKEGLRKLWSDTAWMKASLVRVAPFVLVGVAALALTMIVREMGSAVPRDGTPSLKEFGILERLAQGSAVIVHFLEKTLWPGRLNPVYPLLYNLNPFAPFFLLSMIACAGLGIVLVLAVWRSLKTGLLAFATLAACIPVAGLNEHPFFPCDRYTYIPSISLVALMLSVAGLSVFTRRTSVRLVLPIMLGILPLWLVASKNQTAIWSSTDRLYTEIAAIQTLPIIKSHYLCRRIAERMEEGRIEEARMLLVEVQKQIPTDTNVRAITELLATAEKSKGPAAYAVVLNSQARTALKAGEQTLAIERLQRALRYSPEYAEARFNLGLLLAMRGETQDALGHFLWLTAQRPAMPKETLSALRTALARAFRAEGKEKLARQLEAREAVHVGEQMQVLKQ